MNKLLLCGALFTGLSTHSQTTLFQDNFEAGGGNWTLNGGSGLNQWVINSEYVDNSGFGLVADTPDEPAGVTNGPNSAYLHIYNTQACGFGICNASFDTGSSSNQSATLTPIGTTGFTNVTLTFIYLCDGASGSAYGIVEYSTDGGGTWTAASGQYSGVSTWTNASIALPAFDNAPALKFRFRWQNGNTGNDPAFAIDEVKITGTPGAGATVGTGAITTTTYCSNTTANISVPFTVTGTINSGNVYTAQLSNSAGSFAAPTAIGTLSSTATGSLSISATIPSGLPAGNGYRIRVDASNPATTGTDNGMNLTVAAPPTINATPFPVNGTICAGNSATITASGANTYTWSPAGSLSSSTGSTVTATPSATQVYTVSGIDANGCSNSTTITITVESCAGLEEASFGDFELYPNPASEKLNLNFGELKGIQSVSVLDLSGRTVLSEKVFSNTINIHSLESGKYFLVIEHEAGRSAKAFVKH
ncbi:T9SS type A sorting domain-containing protein [Fluviicola sp.]|uniref:T9SS type A sorting domain-containing protein n=1 Tax=Fluviicola sp. TaxID=1917219 RepID=UPI0031CF9315